MRLYGALLMGKTARKVSFSIRMRMGTSHPARLDPVQWREKRILTDLDDCLRFRPSIRRGDKL